MNRSDHYQDLMLYLDESKNDGSQAVASKKATQLAINDDDEYGDNKYEDTYMDDIDLQILIQINESIKSDVSELFAKTSLHEDNSINSDYDVYNNCYKYLVDNSIYEFEDKTDTLGSDSLGNSIIVDSENNAINTATQRSPSLSPSSTNLTWASECSSSPCLTTSDSDLLDEDAQSTSSTDGRELHHHQQTNHLFKKWECMQKNIHHQIFNGKSSSAPVLKKMPIKVSRHARSQSDRHLAEIEATEACKWLRATGFPQYAQMFEDLQFPIDISTAKQDHPFLELDVLNSLYRRLQILNSCANIHQQKAVAHTDESEEEYCALSDNWSYQTDTRRWSRTIQLPANFEEANNLRKNVVQEKDAVFENKCAECPKDKLRRAGSTKFRRRRDGVLFRDNVLDTISQFNDLKCEVNHVSDSEITPKHQQRLRTKSFDKTDTWAHPHTERVTWHSNKLPITTEICITEYEVTDNTGLQICSLSCTQLQVLKKLSLLKLTAHMEKYCPSHRTGWNWDLPKFIRKIKQPVHKDKNLFGVPLTITFQKTGQVLPRNIEEALRWLQQNAADQVGIFRKPGVKSRIQALRQLVESNAGIDYNDQQHYDVADMVKQYFRELPEALLTNKLSETFILIFQHVPPELRRESVLCALLLMPDEHLEVLQCILHFLLSIAKHAQVNQMNESNLAMCFAPSLFHYSQAYKQSLGSPHPKELAENKAAHECLLYFLNNYNNIFRIPNEFLKQCNSNEIKDTKTVLLSELGADYGGSAAYWKECQSNLLRESKDKRGWISISSHNPKVEIFFQKVADGIPLRFWKVCAEIEAPPSEVLHRILRERHIWDNDLHSAKIISLVDNQTEVFQYVRRNIAPLPNEEYCIVRMWRTGLPKDACLIVETSVEHPEATSIPNTARGIVLASRYLIEPCGSGKSRVLHLSRADTMGRTPDWYHKNYGHLCAVFLANLQNSFCQTASGPESKV